MPEKNTTQNRRKYQTRQNILDTAHSMIVERGIEGLSIRAIAEAIDYSPAALYRYFNSKDQLVDAVRSQCFERLNNAIFERIQNAHNASQQLLLGGMAYINFASKHPVDYRLMFHLEPSSATQAENQQAAMRALLHIVRYGIESGEFATDAAYDETAIVYHCWGTVHGLAMLQSTVMRDEQATIMARTESILRRVIQGFRTDHSNSRN